MSDFWIAQNSERLRIHRGECAACNDGRAPNADWRGPYPTYSDALRMMRPMRRTKYSRLNCEYVDRIFQETGMRERVAGVTARVVIGELNFV